MATMTLMRYSGTLREVINKDVTAIRTLTGNFIQPVTLMNPTVLIEGYLNQLVITNGSVNYAQIDNKYYYITDYSVTYEGHLELSLRLDVLMTYKSQINNMEILVERSSTSPNLDIPDNQLPLSTDMNFERLDFPNKIDDTEVGGIYILCTSQKGYTFADTE